MLLAEAYVDESGSHARSPILCVGGYVYASEKAREFTAELGAVLSEYDLPFFRMSACANGAPPFDKLSNDECDAVARKMIALIKDHSAYGFVVSVNEDDYRRVIPRHLVENFGSPYSFCVNRCLTLIRHWADRSGFSGRVAYFFEAGHKEEGEAHRILELYRESPEATDRFRYSAHAFVEKTLSLPLQSADVIAYQWHKDIKNRLEGRNPRKDLIALIRQQDSAIECTADSLHEMIKHLQEQSLR